MDAPESRYVANTEDGTTMTCLFDVDGENLYRGFVNLKAAESRTESNTMCSKVAAKQCIARRGRPLGLGDLLVGDVLAGRHVALAEHLRHAAAAAKQGFSRYRSRWPVARL